MKKLNILARILTLFFVLLLAACGGGGGATVINSYTIGVSVSGLAGTGLVLQNSGSDDLTIDADGSFTFATAIVDGGAYNVTVATQPGSPNQTCSVANGSGILAGADVTDIAVDCTNNNYTIGVSVSGLAGTGLVLQNNGSDDLTIDADGSFTFATAIVDGGAYSVTVATQPGSPNQTCSVANGSGTLAGADVTDMTVDCTTNTYTIGGIVSGLEGSGLVLQNNVGDDLTIDANDNFTFATAIDDGSAYNVTVTIQPSSPDQICAVTNGNGVLTGANITNVTISCVTTNNPPVADAGSDQSSILGSGSILLDGSNSSDPDNDDLVYAWLLTQIPDSSSVELTSNNSVTVSFTPDVAGSYRIELTVSDGELTATDIIDVDVAENTLPTVNAGPDQQGTMGTLVQLDGSASSDPDNQTLTYTWTQIVSQCPDVTLGVGHLSGLQPSFTLPDEVCTVVFDLRVNDGVDVSFADRIHILSLEDGNHALFVDGANGDDTNPGTRELPYKTIGKGMGEARTIGNSTDVYVAQAIYNVNMLQLLAEVSVYGGYNESWERNRAVFQTQIMTLSSTAVYVSLAGNLVFDGFAVQASASVSNNYGVFIKTSDNVVISNNIIQSAHTGNGDAGLSGSVGTVGGSGSDGICGSNDIESGGAGGAFGDDNYSDLGGGFGGNAGYGEGSFPAGQRGFGLLGGIGGTYGNVGGAGGIGSDGHIGYPASQIGTFGSYYMPSTDSGTGYLGLAGSGGGGGGGGQGVTTTICNPLTGCYDIWSYGAGGGGGGAGGTGGIGDTGGTSGHGSFGIFLANDVSNIQLRNNIIFAGGGGNGGRGGSGGPGGSGGSGGIDGGVGCGGGGGGNGGQGGAGGFGGGGVGGPSIGIAYFSGMTGLSMWGNTIYPGTPGYGAFPNGVDGVRREVYVY